MAKATYLKQSLDILHSHGMPASKKRAALCRFIFLIWHVSGTKPSSGGSFGSAYFALGD
jgi:hypothetical protein